MFINQTNAENTQKELYWCQEEKQTTKEKYHVKCYTKVQYEKFIRALKFNGEIEISESVIDYLIKNTHLLPLVYANAREELLIKNQNLEKENQELEIDKKMLKVLYQEVKDTASFYMSKCERFEKVIEILKKYLYLVMDDSGLIINADSYLLKEESDLLKEFLG